MMNSMPIPFWSAFTLFTELCVSAFVYLIIYAGYRRGVFHRRIAFAVLAYELLFNISYMATRAMVGTHEGMAQIMTPYETGLAIFHGTFSLLMFVTLVAFFLTAAGGYAKGANFFRTHPKMTLAFSIAWLVSVLSGVLFFIQLYLV